MSESFDFEVDPELIAGDPDEHWDHYLPDEDWSRVVVEAEAIREKRLAEETEVGGSDHMPQGITPKRMSFPDTHGKNSGSILRQQLWVIHTAECPLRVGYAESLTRWGNGGYQPRASWQKFVDPATVVSWIPTSRAAWVHAPANRLGIGYEQAGYARFSRAEWLVPDGLRQIDLLAQEVVRDKIPVSGLRWLTDAQVQAIIAGRDTTTRGLCTHAQIAPHNRTDPGKGYPRDVLLDFIRHYHPSATSPLPKEDPTVLTHYLIRGSKDASTGGQVSLLQTMLNGMDKAGLAVDGSFGPAVETAVKAAQRKRALSVDGKVGPSTRTRLNEDWKEHLAPAPAPTPDPAPSPAPTGVTASEVKAIVRAEVNAALKESFAALEEHLSK